MFKLLSKLRYTLTHEWIFIKGAVAPCGINDYAQSQSGSVMFIDLPKVGEKFKGGDLICTIESVKSVSDVYSPVTGIITEVNDLLVDNPELLNSDCYGKGWIFKIKYSNISEVSALLSDKQYLAMMNF